MTLDHKRLDVTEVPPNFTARSYGEERAGYVYAYVYEYGEEENRTLIRPPVVKGRTSRVGRSGVALVVGEARRVKRRRRLT